MSFDLSVLSTGNLCELHEALNTDSERVQREVRALVLKRLDVAPVKRERKAATPKEGEAPAVASSDPKPPSLKEVVRNILVKNPNGLELNQIVTEVKTLIENKEYESKAKSLSAVVSQAVHALRQENVVNHDRENKKYSVVQAA